MTDVIVIGAGLNGLVAAALLAKQKLSVIVVDQRPEAGGAAVTREIAVGYRVPSLSHSLGPVSGEVARALKLDKAALQFLAPDPMLTSLTGDGRALAFHRDEVLTAASIHEFSAADAGRWAEFTKTIQRIGVLLAKLDHEIPPSLDGDERPSWLRMLAIGRDARSLGRRNLERLARWMPMSVADLTGEWFESEPLRAAIAAHAIFGNPAGPRSAGTGAMLLGRVSADPSPVGSGVTMRGGPGAFADAVARLATERGVSIRHSTRVAGLVTKDGRAAGVVLDDGDVLSARAVVAAIGPKATLTQLTPATDLPPTFLSRMRNVRTRGVTAKMNLALDALPAFTALGADAVPLRGRLLIAPDLDYIERAFDATKYGAMSEAPWLEIAIPSVADDSLAPAGKHVMSIHAHFAPRQLRAASWSSVRDRLTASILDVIERHAPALRTHIVAQETLTPEDLERGWGLSGGHITHGEAALDQMWAARPLLGWAQYRTPLAGLYLASAGTHPGGGLTGLPGLLASRIVQSDFKRRVV